MEVVGAFGAAVAGPPGVVPVEDLVVPCEEGVNGAAELGCLAGAVDVGEPVEGFEGAFGVPREIELVQLAERVPGCFEPGVGLEEGVEAFAFCAVEGVGSAHEQESGPEHCGVERGL